MAVIPLHGRWKKWEDQDHSQLHTEFATSLGCSKINKPCDHKISCVSFKGFKTFLYYILTPVPISLYHRHISISVCSALVCVFVCQPICRCMCIHMYRSMCVYVWRPEVVIRCLLSLNTQLANVVGLASLPYGFHLCLPSVRITSWTLIST